VLSVFEIRSARLARLWKIVAAKKSNNVVTVAKEKLSRVSDVVLPVGCSKSPAEWLSEQPEGAGILCHNHPDRHGNACKKSHKTNDSTVLEKFFDFVDNNSAFYGRSTWKNLLYNEACLGCVWHS